MGELTIAGLALLLGMRHALDPDHVVAVSTLAAEERRLWPAAWLGLVWGLGHLLSVAALGLPLVALRLQLPPDVEHLLDAAVGALLIGLGIVTLGRLIKSGVRFDTHEHDGVIHGHFHPPVHGHPAVRWHRRQWVTFGFGAVHGLAGSGAAAVLALQAARDLGGAVAWLLLFGVGTLLGMWLTTLMVAAPALSVASRRVSLHAGVRAMASLASVAVGGHMLWSLLPVLVALGSGAGGLVRGDARGFDGDHQGAL